MPVFGKGEVDSSILSGSTMIHSNSKASDDPAIGAKAQESAGTKVEAAGKLGENVLSTFDEDSFRRGLIIGMRAASYIVRDRQQRPNQILTPKRKAILDRFAADCVGDIERTLAPFGRK